MKKFGELFKESWKEYKSNFKVFLVILLLLGVIPGLIMFILQIPFNLEFYNLGNNDSAIFSLIFNSIYSIPLFILSVVSILLSIFMSSSFIYNAIYRKKQMDVRETLRGGRKYFWKYLLFIIVYLLFIIGLSLLFIIPGVIFFVFWIFAPYILIKENKGIIESLRTSYYLVKGKWWNTLGFILLFSLITFGIMILISLIFGIISLLISLPFMASSILETGSAVLESGLLFPAYINLIIQFLDLISSWLISLIVTPLGILFFKNFYLDRNKSKK